MHPVRHIFVCGTRTCACMRISMVGGGMDGRQRSKSHHAPSQVITKATRITTRMFTNEGSSHKIAYDTPHLEEQDTHIHVHTFLLVHTFIISKNTCKAANNFWGWWALDYF